MNSRACNRSSAWLALRSLLWTILLPGVFAGYVPWRLFGLGRTQFDLTSPTQLLGLVCGDDVFKTVAVLSDGEKSRLALVRLLLDPPNLLLMDEPTTHLDVGSIDALIGALKQYHGTLIFISHDVHFIRAIATSVLHVTAGANRTGSKLTFYPGDHDYYLDKSKATSARTALTADRDASAVNGLAAASKLQPGIRKQTGSGSSMARRFKIFLTRVFCGQRPRLHVPAPVNNRAPPRDVRHAAPKSPKPGGCDDSTSTRA